jgi:hypothetical protein
MNLRVIACVALAANGLPLFCPSVRAQDSVVKVIASVSYPNPAQPWAKS